MFEIKVTWRPSCRSEAATSMPIHPPPMIAIDVAFDAAARIESASDALRR